MFRLIVVLACVAGSLAGVAKLDERILGGTDAQAGQFPYQISMRLRENGQHHCGGTIINNKFVVTAAHCVYQHNVNDFIVVAGSHLLNQGGVAYTLENINYHGNYDPQTLLNDIALLKINGDFQFSSLVQPLPLQSTPVPEGSSLVLSGWGATSWPPQGGPPNNLKYVNLRSVNSAQCANAMAPMPITNAQICTYTRVGQGACGGDSGGPLAYQGRLAGVVSWGRPCAVGVPDIFTSVPFYNDWIVQVMQSM